MEALTFVPIDEAEFAHLVEWHRTDEATRLYLCRPTPEYLQYLCTGPNAHGWMVHEGETPVAFLQLDTEEGIGYVAWAVNPDLRRRGYGRRAVRALLARPEVAALTCVVATLEPENVASQRCAEAAGFVLESAELDKDGMLRYVYTVPQ